MLYLDGGEIVHDNITPPNDISVWRKVQESLSVKPASIGLAILDNKNVVKSIVMGEGSDYFFFSKRSRFTLGDHSSKEEYGIGYHDRVSNNVRVTWYDSDLNPIDLDIRDFDKCLPTLIPKNLTASLYQS
jgi:hypothetical protein